LLLNNDGSEKVIARAYPTPDPNFGLY